MITIPISKAIQLHKHGTDNHIGTYHSKIMFHRNTKLTEMEWSNIWHITNDICDANFSFTMVMNIIKLFPSRMIEYKLCCGSTNEQIGHIYNAISLFFLGCTYPVYGDMIDMEDYLAALRDRVLDFLED